MTVAARILVVLAAVLLVVVAVRLIGRWQRPSHPAIDLGDFGPRPGVVLFTSTDCSNCRRAREVLASLDLQPREVTWELEPTRFEQIGVEAVPLTVVVDAEGSVELLAASVPRRRAIQRASQRAGVLG